MFSTLPRRQINAVQAQEVAGKIIEQNGHRYAAFSQSGVYALDGDRWINLLTIVRPSDSKPSDNLQLDYGSILVARRGIDATTIAEALRGVCAGRLLANETRIYLETTLAWEYDFLSSNNAYSELPSHIFQGSARLTSRHQFSEPLLHYQHPYYQDAYHAIREVLGISDFLSHNDARLGSILFLLPETRAALSVTKSGQNEAQIGIRKALDFNEELRIKGAQEDTGTLDRFEYAEHELPFSLHVGDTTQRVDLWLMTSLGEVLDFDSETRFRTRRGALNLFGLDHDDQSGVLDVHKMIERGEGPAIELKPYIEPSDEKMQEIIRTVIAFGNSGGGTILIGVTDIGAIEGINKPLRKKMNRSSKSLLDQVHQYIGQIRKVLSDRLNANPGISISSTRSDDAYVVIIAVQPSENIIYYDIQTKEIFIRRGASNRRPDPEHELKALYQKNPEPFGTLS